MFTLNKEEQAGPSTGFKIPTKIKISEIDKQMECSSELNGDGGLLLHATIHHLGIDHSGHYIIRFYDLVNRKTITLDDSKLRVDQLKLQNNRIAPSDAYLVVYRVTRRQKETKASKSVEPLVINPSTSAKKRGRPKADLKDPNQKSITQFFKSTGSKSNEHVERSLSLSLEGCKFVLNQWISKSEHEGKGNLRSGHAFKWGFMSDHIF